jgi:transketolase
LIATGSEVQLALSTGKELQTRGISARVVSMPCWSLFDAQPAEYRESVLPGDVQKRISVEAGTTLGWEHYVGLQGISMGVSHFGISAPGEQVYREFGLTPQKTLETALKLLMGGRE